MANHQHLYANPFTGYLLDEAVALGIFTTQQIGAPGYGVGGATQALGAYGRGGRPGLRIHISSTNDSIGYYNMVTKTMPSVNTTCIFSFAFRYSAAQVNINLPFFTILDNDDAQVSLRLNNDGTVSAYLGGFPGATLIGTADYTISAGALVKINGRVVIHNSAGTVDLWFNGNPTTSLSLTGQNTRATAASQWTAFALGPRWTSNIFNPVVSDADWDVSELVVKDGSLALAGGVGATDPIGDAQVDWLQGVTGDGDDTEFSCFVGSDHGAMVDDATQDGDTSFNAGGPGAGQKDSYFTESLSPGGTVLAVITEETMRKDGAGAALVTPYVISDGNSFDGDATHALTEEYVMYPTVFIDFDGDTITPDLVNAMQAGPKTA